MYDKTFIWVRVDEEGIALKAFSSIKLAAAATAKEIFELSKEDFVETMLSWGYTLTSIRKALKDENSLKELKNKFISKVDEVDLENIGWQKITLNDYKEVF